MAASYPRDCTFETPIKLNKLISELIAIDAYDSNIGHNSNIGHGSSDEESQSWWGICVDTAHLWALGQDIQTKQSMRDWLNAIEHKNKIMIFHLNGSRRDISTGKDEHAIAFAHDDKLWYGIEPSDSGVAAVLEFAKKHKTTIIIEPHKETHASVTNIVSVLKKMY
jgi:sugar phosphate isomerase/epimerase